MIYSSAHMATVGVKGLRDDRQVVEVIRKQSKSCQWDLETRMSQSLTSRGS